jgi:hypothetical protein
LSTGQGGVMKKLLLVLFVLMLVCSGMAKKPHLDVVRNKGYTGVVLKNLEGACKIKFIIRNYDKTEIIKDGKFEFENKKECIVFNEKDIPETNLYWLEVYAEVNEKYYQFDLAVIFNKPKEETAKYRRTQII